MGEITIRQPHVGKASFDELLHIRWKTQSDRKIKSKDEMRDDGIESPDVADAFMLSFAKEGSALNMGQDDPDKLFDKYNIFGNVA
jgi:hypothetical protein